VQFDADLNNGKNAAARQQLLRRSNGAGKLRVTMGIFKNNQQFAGARFAEDSFSDTTFPPGCLPRKLFHPGFRRSQVQMDVGLSGTCSSRRGYCMWGVRKARLRGSELVWSCSGLVLRRVSSPRTLLCPSWSRMFSKFSSFIH